MNSKKFLGIILVIVGVIVTAVGVINAMSVTLCPGCGWGYENPIVIAQIIAGIIVLITGIILVIKSK